MSAKTYCGMFLAILSITFSSQLIYNYYKRRKQQRMLSKKEINEVIMFSNDLGELKVSKYSRTMITPNVDRLLHYLNSPQYNIDICMYIITNQYVSNALMKLYYKGIKIRIIIDADMAYSNKSCIKKLQNYGIPVRWMKSGNLMHHKYCLVDTLYVDDFTVPFVMMGSMNWTNQALNGNWEDVTVTSQPDLVKQYQAEFENLWALFKPIVDF